MVQTGINSTTAMFGNFAKVERATQLLVYYQHDKTASVNHDTKLEAFYLAIVGDNCQSKHYIPGPPEFSLKFAASALNFTKAISWKTD